MHAVDVAAQAQTKPSVRRADLSDANDLARLRWLWRAVERGEHGDPDRFRDDFVTWVADHERTHLPFLVEIGGSAVGMAWLVVTERIPGPERWKRRSGDLQSVYVMAAHRDGGLGTLLIRRLIEVAEDEELSYLSVHPSSRSFPFYRRHGFTGEGDLLIRYMDLRAR
jgi:GNAT superfamily N-acetyltransferase